MVFKKEWKMKHYNFLVLWVRGVYSEQDWYLNATEDQVRKKMESRRRRKRFDSVRILSKIEAKENKYRHEVYH